jgi:hypothetical protein
MVRLLLVAVLATMATAGALGTTAPVAAACGSPVPIESALQQANTVFVGEVTGLSDRNREATMRVLEVWKGRDLPSTVLVEGGSDGITGVGADDRTFQTTRTYLVLSADTRSPFESDRCTATRLYRPIGGRAIPGNMAAVVGVSIARAPLSAPGDEATGADGSSILPFINVGLVAMGLLAAAYMYKRLSSSKRRVRQGTPTGRDYGKADGTGTDSIGKLSRRVSVTGMLGRSGLGSSKKMRGRRQLRRARGSRGK